VNGDTQPAQLYSAQVVTQDLIQMINVIRELAGGAFIMLPSSFKADQSGARADHPQDPAAQRRSIRKGKVKFSRRHGMPLARKFGIPSYPYEMFYAGARFVTAGHSYRTYGWGERGSWSTAAGELQLGRNDQQSEAMMLSSAPRFFEFAHVLSENRFPPSGQAEGRLPGLL